MVVDVDAAVVTVTHGFLFSLAPWGDDEDDGEAGRETRTRKAIGRTVEGNAKAEEEEDEDDGEEWGGGGG